MPLLLKNQRIGLIFSKIQPLGSQRTLGKKDRSGIILRLYAYSKTIDYFFFNDATKNTFSVFILTCVHLIVLTALIRSLSLGNIDISLSGRQ